MTKYLFGSVLFLLSIVLIFVLAPISITYTVLKSVWKMSVQYFVLFSRLFYFAAYSVDRLGNVMCQFFFNDILIQKDGYKFGNPNETVSAVLGMNKKYKTLTKFGSYIVILLDFLDKNHVEKAAKQEIIDKNESN